VTMRGGSGILPRCSEGGVGRQELRTVEWEEEKRGREGDCEVGGAGSGQRDKWFLTSALGVGGSSLWGVELKTGVFFFSSI